MFLGRIPVPGEPLWTDDDREWAMALLAYEADLCECGQPRSESTDPASEGAYRAEPLRCHACSVIARSGEAFAQAGGDVKGLLYSVTKTRRAHG